MNLKKGASVVSQARTPVKNDKARFPGQNESILGKAPRNLQRGHPCAALPTAEQPCAKIAGGEIHPPIPPGVRRAARPNPKVGSILPSHGHGGQHGAHTRGKRTPSARRHHTERACISCETALACIRKHSDSPASLRSCLTAARSSNLTYKTHRIGFKQAGTLTLVPPGTDGILPFLTF